MKILIIIGSRHWPARLVVWETLARYEPDLIIHGASPTGIDAMGAQWAAEHGVAQLPLRAQWASLGRSAAVVSRDLEMAILGAWLRDSYSHDVQAIAAPWRGCDTHKCIPELENRGIPVEVLNV